MLKLDSTLIHLDVIVESFDGFGAIRTLDNQLETFDAGLLANLINEMFAGPVKAPQHICWTVGRTRRALHDTGRPPDNRSVPGDKFGAKGPNVFLWRGAAIRVTNTQGEPTCLSRAAIMTIPASVFTRVTPEDVRARSAAVGPVAREAGGSPLTRRIIAEPSRRMLVAGPDDGNRAASRSPGLARKESSASKPRWGFASRRAMRRSR